MQILRPIPDLFDLDAWQRRLEELQADPPSEGRDGLIMITEAHIAALRDTPEKSPLVPPAG